MTYETDEDKELYEKKRCSFNGSVDVGSIVSFRMWGEESIRNGIRRKWREQRLSLIHILQFEGLETVDCGEE